MSSSASEGRSRSSSATPSWRCSVLRWRTRTSRARRSRGTRHPRLDPRRAGQSSSSASASHGPGTRLPRRPARGGRGDGRGRRSQHGGAAAVERTRQRHPRRRDDVARDPRCDRLPARRAGPGQGKGRAGRGLGGARGARPRGRRHLHARANAARRPPRELDSLLDAFERAQSARSVQLVTLVGEPGIGKSRLVYELFGAVERDPELVFWRQGRSLPYGEGVSFWALGEMVKAHTGILETDSEQEPTEKLRATVTATVPAERASSGRSHTSALSQASRTRAAAATTRKRRSLPGGASSRASPTNARSSSSSRISIGRTTACSTSSTTSSTGRARAAARGLHGPSGAARAASGLGGGKTNALTLSLAPLSGDETARARARATRARR